MITDTQTIRKLAFSTCIENQMLNKETVFIFNPILSIQHYVTLEGSTNCTDLEFSLQSCRKYINCTLVSFAFTTKSCARNVTFYVKVCKYLLGYKVILHLKVLGL